MDGMEPKNLSVEEPGVDQLFWLFLAGLTAACLVAYYMADYFFFG